MAFRWRIRPTSTNVEATPARQPRRRRGAASLPPAVLEVIDAAGIAPRASRDDASPRALVFLPGWQPFIFTDEKAEGVVGKIFPELDDDQVRRATRRLRMMVLARLRTADVAKAAADGSVDSRPWINRW